MTLDDLHKSYCTDLRAMLTIMAKLRWSFDAQDYMRGRDADWFATRLMTHHPQRYLRLIGARKVADAANLYILARDGGMSAAVLWKLANG